MPNMGGCADCRLFRYHCYWYCCKSILDMQRRKSIDRKVFKSIGDMISSPIKKIRRGLKDGGLREAR